MPGRLDRSPKKNWVEKAGGLPDYIERIAVHLKRKGMTTSHAIAVAINAVKKMRATGDVNWPGLQNVNMGSRAQACAAVARWTAMKASRSEDEADPEWGDLWHQAKVLDDANRLHELDGIGEEQMNDFSGLAGFDAEEEPDALALDDETTPLESRASGDFESKHPRAKKGEPAGGQFVKKGSKGKEAEKVKEKLDVKGEDGFGEKTEKAVKDFQKKHGLKVDGVVGKQTAAAMKGKKDAKDVKPGALTENDREYLRGKKQSKRSADPDEHDFSNGLSTHRCAEFRSVPFKDVDMQGRRFRGYAAVYDAEANLGEFTEEIRRGAFRKVLSGDPYVPMLYNHNGQLPPLASTRSGMTLKEDGKGLVVDAELADHHWAQAVLEGVNRGDIRGMSFGFVAGPGNSEITRRNGGVHRAITNFKALLDVSPTHDPAYAETSAEVRSMIRQATLIETSQTDLDGQQPQIEEPVVEDEAAEQDEQRSGVSLEEIEAAARQRELDALAIQAGLTP